MKSKVSFKKLYAQKENKDDIVPAKKFIGNRFDRRRMKKLKKFVLSNTFTLTNRCFRPDAVIGIEYDNLDKAFYLTFEHDDVYFILQIEKDLWDCFLNINEKDLYIKFTDFYFALKLHSIGSMCLNDI